MSDERIKKKIRNLLELGRRSQFPHEAEAAKTQALALMRRFNLTEQDLYSKTVEIKTPEQQYVDQLIVVLKHKAWLEKQEHDNLKRIELLKKIKLIKIISTAVFGIFLTLVVVGMISFALRG